MVERRFGVTTCQGLGMYVRHGGDPTDFDAVQVPRVLHHSKQRGANVRKAVASGQKGDTVTNAALGEGDVQTAQDAVAALSRLQIVLPPVSRRIRQKQSGLVERPDSLRGALVLLRWQVVQALEWHRQRAPTIHFHLESGVFPRQIVEYAARAFQPVEPTMGTDHPYQTHPRALSVEVPSLRCERG
jgi:hypothetical protein